MSLTKKMNVTFLNIRLKNYLKNPKYPKKEKTLKCENNYTLNYYCNTSLRELFYVLLFPLLAKNLIQANENNEFRNILGMVQ